MVGVEPFPSPFGVSVVPNRDEVAVVVTGDLDLATAGAVEQEVVSLRETGFERIVIDLQQVAFIDSSGLHMLFRVNDLALHDGFALSMIEPSGSAGRIFELTSTRSAFRWRDRLRP